jgi:hypothetical protein
VGALETVEDQVKPELVLVAVVAAALETCSMASSESSPDFGSYSAQAVNPEAAAGANCTSSRHDLNSQLRTQEELRLRPACDLYRLFNRNGP